MYKILMAEVQYNDYGEIEKITLLVNFTLGNSLFNSFILKAKKYDIRVIYTDWNSQYCPIPPGTTCLTAELAQRVAGMGQQVFDNNRMFHRWKRQKSKYEYRKIIFRHCSLGG